MSNLCLFIVFLWTFLGFLFAKCLLDAMEKDITVRQFVVLCIVVGPITVTLCGLYLCYLALEKVFDRGLAFLVNYWKKL